MYKPGWKPGRWSAICDRCGFRFHSNKIRTEWDNLKVCASCWEQRNPQDFVKVAPERIVPLWTRPEATDTFLLVCDFESSSAYADVGVADCMRADNITFSFSDVGGIPSMVDLMTYLYLEQAPLFNDQGSLGI